GLVVAAEEIGVVLQWIPVRGHGDELTQVGLADVQYKVVGQVVGHAQPLARILKHPHAGGDNGAGHLHGGGVLVWHRATGRVDVEVGAAPPRLVRVPHHQGAQNVGPADDFVGHDTHARLQPVVEAAQLVE